MSFGCAAVTGFRSNVLQTLMARGRNLLALEESCEFPLASRAQVFLLALVDGYEELVSKMLDNNI